MLPGSVEIDLPAVVSCLPPGGAFVTLVSANDGGVALALRAGSPAIASLQLPGMSWSAVRGVIAGDGGDMHLPDSWSAGYQRFRRSLDARPRLQSDAWCNWDGIIQESFARLGEMGWGGIHRWLREELDVKPGSEVVFSVPGWLSVIPLAAVPDPATERCLLDDYAVRLIPNADLLVRSAATAKAADPADYSLLAVEDPTEDLLPRNAKTRCAWRQLEQCREVLPGRSATVAETLSRLPHFTHYLNYSHGRRQRRRGVLQLAPAPGRPGDKGLLSDARVRQLRLPRCRLAILAACESGLIDWERQPEEHNGMATSFLFAGSACVIASLWPVEAESTRRLVEQVLERHFRGDGNAAEMSPAQALRLAQLQLRDGLRGMKSGPIQHARPCGKTSRKPPPLDTRHAFFWAAFSCLGA
jgi:CHAT domain-containing protein